MNLPDDTHLQRYLGHTDAHARLAHRAKTATGEATARRGSNRVVDLDQHEEGTCCRIRRALADCPTPGLRSFVDPCNGVRSDDPWSSCRELRLRSGPTAVLGCNCSSDRYLAHPKVRTHRATEARGVDEADRQLRETQEWVNSILARLQPYLPHAKPLQVLDVGAAQGKALIAFQRCGHTAVGVEPWPEAMVVAHELAARHRTPVDIRKGAVEQLPFGDEEFDLVVAMSVMEHVRDLPQGLREVFRVLRPGGIFWFNSASSMSPRQAEIAGFPMFGWYPLPLKRRIMWWALAHKPNLIGYTRMPALNWFTPWSARRKLRRAGFEEIWDRWDLYLPDEASGIARVVVKTAKHLRPVRIIGDVLIPGCTFAARKPSCPIR